MANHRRERRLRIATVATESRCAGDTGTALANYSCAPSCDLAPSNPAVWSWGGARNRADRESWNLTERQCRDMIAAADFALANGLPFNRHWIVHYERAQIAETDAAKFVGHLLRLASAYVRREVGQLAALWARENGDGKGGHVHILLHVPAGITLRNRTRRWIVAAGGTYRARVSRVKVIGGTLNNVDPASPYYRENMRTLVGYLLKGATTATGSAMGLHRYSEGGRIVGKRAGWTQNIGKSARAERAESFVRP